jgi:branched-chain amino acid transport system permease protein
MSREKATTYRDFFLIVATVGILGYLLSEFLAPYPQTVAAMCGINIILAVSLNLVNGLTGQFSMGHAGFMAAGAYTSATLSVLVLPWLGISADGFLHYFIFFAIVILSGAVSALVGACVGIPSLRLKGDYLAIVTLGFGEIIRTFILNIETIGGARGFIGIPQWSNLYWIFGTAIFSVVLIQRLISSIPGKQFMAVRDDETAATAMGLSTTKIKVRAFVIASFFAGVAGALFAHQYAYLNPSTFNFNYSFQIITMVVLGGMGSMSGSITAAIFLTAMLELLRPLQDLTRIDLRMVIYALILIVLMLTRPQGIFGRKELWQYLRFKKDKPHA